MKETSSLSLFLKLLCGPTRRRSVCVGWERQVENLVKQLREFPVNWAELLSCYITSCECVWYLAGGAAAALHLSLTSWRPSQHFTSGSPPGLSVS